MGALLITFTAPAPTSLAFALSPATYNLSLSLFHQLMKATNTLYIQKNHNASEIEREFLSRCQCPE